MASKVASVVTEDVYQASLKDFVETPTPSKVNVAVVSFDNYWKEVDNSLTRHLPWPRTTWIFKKGGLLRYVVKNGAADRFTVAIVPSLSADWRDIVDYVKAELHRTFVRWIVTPDNLTFSHSAVPVSVLPSCLAGTSQGSHLTLDVSKTDPDGSPLLYGSRPHHELSLFKHSTKKTSLVGKVMKIGCLRQNEVVNHDYCLLHSYLFDMLEAKNVSLLYRLNSDWSTTLDDLNCENTDMAVLLMPLNEHVLAMATYGEVKMVSETFYALASRTQAPSIYDTTLRSAFTVAVTAAALTTCAGLLVLIGGSHVRERAQSETLFLLALLLARSTPFPNATRWPRVQNIVYLFWALAMLPLSQYFQCELTSVVTVGRPANSLDTLEELEAALDAGAVAPCVPKETATLANLEKTNHSTTLGKKLQASLLKHRSQLVKHSVRSCLDCATKPNGVCHLQRMPSSIMKGFAIQVIPFDENFVTRPGSLPVRKTFPLKDAFRAFLQRVREGDLLSSPQCKGEMICKRSSSSQSTSEKETPLFELHGFFTFYAVLLSSTEDVQPSLQDFMETPSPAKVNLAVVSFDEYWLEADNSLTRRLPRPKTTWTFKKGGFHSYILKNSAADVSTVAIVPSLRFDCLLKVKNVSLEYQFHSNWSTMLYDLYCEHTDMVVLIVPLHENVLAASTYSDIILLPETFYALESNVEVPCLFDTTFRSAVTVTVTAASLAICAGLLVMIGGYPLQERAQTETLFLVAILLATSCPLPNRSRRPRVQHSIYLFWALAMLPLSQYFRCDLTSLVMVGRPSSSLDTLQELEAALDAGATAPCVPRESASWDGILNWDHPTTLGKKLRASLLKHRDKLVTANLLSCFECATRSGSVCYAHRMPSSLIKGMPVRVAAFDENFMTRLCTMPLRKSYPLRDAYRAFLQRVREGGLQSSPYCKHDMACMRYSRVETASEMERPLFELHGFFEFYIILLAGTAVSALAMHITQYGKLSAGCKDGPRF
ncbi:hypothetical protein HPB52_004593 [Rhipicephalus sanguineus]|uniref:Uncharacterized protein n=1 Tax=Rhipicephalus sanguineus TaxID=34632 RepID=A0A9D4QDA1_RHISA|nr:hypothetical protein HPB52_004593 [Rhipicephalus sanguineus]